MGRMIDMIGERCGKLLVLDLSGTDRQGQKLWRCRCDCGAESVVRGRDLRSGHTQTCGGCISYAVEGEYVRCTVANGRSFVFDTDDFDLVRSFSWGVDRRGYVSNHNILLHRLLARPASDEVVDHINGNPSDNRRENLRVTEQRYNCYNQKLRKNNVSGYKGVYFRKDRNRYASEIHPGGQKVWLGHYDNPEEAAAAYNMAAVLLFGEYAKLNAV